MSDNSRIYRIDWSYLDEDGVVTDYTYIGAESEEEALGEMPKDDDIDHYSIREATTVEVEAYVAGYEDGSDASSALNILEAIINGKYVAISDEPDSETDEKFDEIIKDLKMDPEEGKE